MSVWVSKGFREVVGSARVECSLPMPILTENSRLQDHRDVHGGRVCLEPAQHFVAVDIGEYEVQHDGVNLETRKPQGIAAGGRLTHVEACCRERARHAVAGVRPIIDDQDDADDTPPATASRARVGRPGRTR